MKGLTTLFTSLIILVSFTTAGYADSLLLNSLEGVTRPNRGMELKDVVKIFGQPKTKSESIGNPPISRWDYGTYIVFFEHNRVIDAMVKHQLLDSAHATNE